MAISVRQTRARPAGCPLVCLTVLHDVAYIELTAGCLLELKAPVTELTPSAIDSPYPGLARIRTSSVLSSSYPGVVLMKWTAKGDDEISLKEGERVRVYKKYCHW